MPTANRIKCRCNYWTVPVPGFASPERVRVLRHADGLPGYFVVRFLDNDTSCGTANTVSMAEEHLGPEAP